MRREHASLLMEVGLGVWGGQHLCVGTVWEAGMCDLPSQAAAQHSVVHLRRWEEEEEEEGAG